MSRSLHTRLRWSFPAVLALALACGEGDGATEPAGDSSVAADAPGVPDVPAPRTAELTYHHDIQPIYRTWCADCHTGDSPTDCAGETCFVDFYEALHFMAKTCADWNMAKCGLKRIQDTAADLPNKLVGKDGKPVILPDADIDRISRWIDLGMPER